MSATDVTTLFGTLAARIHTASAKTRSWGFTCASGGEGTTTLATGTALALCSLQTEPVLLIDANWIGPALTQAAGADGERRLDTYLRSHIALSDVVMPTSIPTLALLPTRVVNEEIALDRIRALLNEASTQFRYVLVDLPPVLAATPVVLSWAANLDRMAVVVTRGLTRRAKMQRAIDTLAAVTQPALVLNRAMGVKDGRRTVAA